MSGTVPFPREAEELVTELNRRIGVEAEISLREGLDTKPHVIFKNPFTDKKAVVQGGGAPSSSEPPHQHGQGQLMGVALYDFNAQRPEDLNMKKGDKVIIVEKTASQNDWWKGKIGMRTGMFPANYVEVRKG